MILHWLYTVRYVPRCAVSTLFLRLSHHTGHPEMGGLASRVRFR